MVLHADVTNTRSILLTPNGGLVTPAVAVLAGGVTSLAAEVTRATNAEAALAPKAGPTFTGTVTVPTPTVDGAAANKGYVDAQISAAVAAALNITTIETVNDKTITNSTTLSADTELATASLAAGKYAIDWHLAYQLASGGGTTTDVNMSLTTTGSMTGIWASALDSDPAGAAGTAKSTQHALTDTLSAALTDTSTAGTSSTVIRVHLEAVVVVTTAGTVTLNWAENTASTAGLTRLGAYSFVVVRRLR